MFQNSLEYSMLWYNIIAFTVANKDLFHILHDSVLLRFLNSEVQSSLDVGLVYS